MLLLHPLESTSLPLFHLFNWTWVCELLCLLHSVHFFYLFVIALISFFSYPGCIVVVLSTPFFLSIFRAFRVIHEFGMDLTSIFLFCLISLVIGAVLMILVQYYLFVKYFNQPDDDPNAENQRNRSLNEKYQLPDVSWILRIHLWYTCIILFDSD